MPPVLKLSEKGKEIAKEIRDQKGLNKDDSRLLKEASKILEPQKDWESISKNSDIYANGASPASLKRFFNGVPIKTETFQAFCRALLTIETETFQAFCEASGVSPKEVSVSWKGLIENASDFDSNDTDVQESQENGIYQQFQGLIDDKTKAFVGREYVFEAINKFVTNQSKGYFIIEGDPGIGKSTILAEYVKRTSCIAYFNYISSGNTSEAEFLESVCQQIISLYKLPYPSLPEKATENGGFFRKLLNEVKESNLHENLVITIDALDEVIGVTSKEDSKQNILYLPSDLPDRVYFIMTRRRLKKQTLMVADNVSKYIFDLMEYTKQNLEDTRLFVQQEVTKKDGKGNLKREGLSEWIEKKNSTVEDFVNRLTEKSEGNFIYLVFVLNSIENGFYDETNLETIPKNLMDYYDSLCQRVEMFSGLLRYTKAQIVYILSETNNPIPYEEIVEIIKYTEVQNPELIVDEVLDVLIQVLRQQQIDGQDFYSPYHHTYRDFLRENKTVKRAGITIEGIQDLIADSINFYGDD